MKALIHIGTHKTATTAFQHIMYNGAKQLKDFGIYYPIGQSYSHNLLAREIRDGKTSLLIAHAKKALDLSNGEGILFISSEELEYLLIDPVKAVNIENELLSLGYTDIYWNLTCRDPFNYLQSLYAELSKNNGIIVDYKELTLAIVKYGYFKLFSKKTLNTYVFDYSKYCNNFKELVNGKLYITSFNDFVRKFPGESLLRIAFDLAGSPKVTANLLLEEYGVFYQANINQISNKSPNELDVEISYSAKFFGFRNKKTIFTRDTNLGHLICTMAEQRLARKKEMEKQSRKLFKETFKCL